MSAEYSKLILATQHIKFGFADTNRLRRGKQIVASAIIQLGETLVQINVKYFRVQRPYDFNSRPILSGQNAQIDIAKRPESFFRVGSGNCPAFH